LSSYNSQYEEYYSRFKPGRRKRDVKEKRPKRSRGDYLAGRIIRDLAGVLILIVLLTGCRLVQTPQTQAVYKYSRDILNKSYNYTEVSSVVKNNVLYWMNKFKVKVPDIDKFSRPVQGVITSPYGSRTDPVTGGSEFHDGMDIDVKENTPVAAAYNGRVKSCGEDSELGKYIVLDHGNGVETKYGHLNIIMVSKVCG
jgi:murein DD-endopeptidase MepM/ murein hydrolase activator NlpD